MNTSTTIPIMVTEEAAAHVAALGMRAELEEMLDHARQAVTDLRRIEVELRNRYDLGDEPSVVITAFKDLASYREEDRPYRAWRDWYISRFPPEVCVHFCLLISYEAADAR
ncbi:MAG TPA: hypothetical protein VFA26_22685 [Gemmataceae bacterium]|nr:hypothetical protein [Gemmataceae bacterium]